MVTGYDPVKVEHAQRGARSFSLFLPRRAHAPTCAKNAASYLDIASQRRRGGYVFVSGENAVIIELLNGKILSWPHRASCKQRNDALPSTTYSIKELQSKTSACKYKV